MKSPNMKKLKTWSVTRDVTRREVDGPRRMREQFLGSEHSIRYLKEINLFEAGLLYMRYSNCGKILALSPIFESAIVMQSSVGDGTGMVVRTGHTVGAIASFDWIPHSHNLLVVNNVHCAIELLDLETESTRCLMNYRGTRYDYQNRIGYRVGDSYPFRVHPETPNNVLVSDRYAKTIFNVDVRVRVPMAISSNVPYLMYSTLALNPRDCYEFVTIGTQSRVFIFDIRYLRLPKQVVRYKGIDCDQFVTALESSIDGNYFVIGSNSAQGLERISVVQKDDPKKSSCFLPPKQQCFNNIYGPRFYGPNSEFVLAATMPSDFDSLSPYCQVNVYNRDTGKMVRQLVSDGEFIACNERFPTFAVGCGIVSVWGFDNMA